MVDIEICNELKMLFNTNLINTIQETLIKQLEYTDWIDLRDCNKIVFKLSFGVYIEAHIDGIEDYTIIEDVMKLNRLVYLMVDELGL